MEKRYRNKIIIITIIINLHWNQLSDCLRQVEDLREENKTLRQDLADLRREMDEMYDTFRENEQDEFRELQRELDMTAKNCRVLQFKLRKAERRADQVRRCWRAGGGGGCCCC